MALTGGGPGGATETLATQVYKETFALSNFGFGAALALMLTVIILVFSGAAAARPLETVRKETRPMFRYTKATAVREVGRLGLRPARRCCPSTSWSSRRSSRTRSC